MSQNTPILPDGLRLYAIGDIHGCLDYLKNLLQKIDEDSANFSGTVHKIFLGDYIDRGLQSKQTIEFMIELQKQEKNRSIFLLGNHEQVMLKLLRESDPQLLQNWLSFGGRETLLSYGINPSRGEGGGAEIFAAMARIVPQTHIDFLNGLELSTTFGDYFFCHAGVRPNVPLAKQSEQDLIWIRHEFLNHSDSFEKVIVHGHTIAHDVQLLPNRIGIDTGAYATGCLTALGLEAEKQWILQTRKAA